MVAGIEDYSGRVRNSTPPGIGRTHCVRKVAVFKCRKFNLHDGGAGMYSVDQPQFNFEFRVVAVSLRAVTSGLTGLPVTFLPGALPTRLFTAPTRRGAL